MVGAGVTVVISAVGSSVSGTVVGVSVIAVTTGMTGSGVTGLACWTLTICPPRMTMKTMTMMIPRAMAAGSIIHFIAITYQMVSV